MNLANSSGTKSFVLSFVASRCLSTISKQRSSNLAMPMYRKLNCGGNNWHRRSRVLAAEEDPAIVEESQENENELIKPNYAAWIISFMTVIAVFYGVVFYAGAGFFYFLSKKIGFQKKNYVPYSVKMEQERQASEGASLVEEAPLPETSGSE